MTGRALALSLLSRRRYCCVDMNRPWGGFLLIIAGLLLPLTIPAAMVAVPYALEIAISGAVGCENRTVAEYFSPDASMKLRTQLRRYDSFQYAGIDPARIFKAGEYRREHVHRGQGSWTRPSDYVGRSYT